MPAPPLPLPSAIVDPRVGDLGPALLALADGTVFPGIAFGAPARGRRRPRRQHEPDGLPGGLHGPLVRRPGRGDDLSAHRQLRPAARRRPVGAAVAAGTGRRQRHRGRRRVGGAARGAPPRRGDPGDRRDRHPGAGPPPPDERLGPGHRHGAGRDRPGRRRRGRPRAARAGRTRTSSTSSRRRRRARSATRPRAGRSSRSSTTGSRRTSSARSAGAGRGSASCPTPSAPSEALAAEIDGLVLSPGPGDPSRLAGPVALARAAIADGRPLLGICLGHQIVGRAAGAETRRLRFGHHGANHPVRDVDTGRVQVTAQNHEVQVVGDTLPAGRRLPRQPGQPQRRLGRGPPPSRAADRDRPVPPRGRPRPARRAGGVRPVRRRVRRPAGAGTADERRGARRPPRSSSSARGRSSSARRPSSTTPGPRPAGRSAPRGSGRSWSTRTRRRS